MNGVNLNHFQFEYDLTWMAFFQNGDGRTYARYGGREDSDSETHLSQASLLTTMQSVLKLHADGSVQPISRYEPLPKEAETPSDIPTMRPMIAKREEKCIHCHDVKVARLRHSRDLDQLSKQQVFTYPSPANLGIHVDPDQQSKIKKVKVGSPAAKAGLAGGDELVSSDGQRILTYADFTRVLELSPKTGQLPLNIARDGREETIVIELLQGWRSGQSRDDFDPSWRASLGVLGPGGGFWGEPLKADKRKAHALRADDLAIRVTFIWADHAKKLGLKNNDIVIGVDGQTNNMTMRQFHAYLQLNRDWGDQVDLTLLRGGKKLIKTMQLPTEPLEN